MGLNLQRKSGGMIIDCFFLFASADQREGGRWLEEDKGEFYQQE